MYAIYLVCVFCDMVGSMTRHDQDKYFCEIIIAKMA